MSVLTGGVRGGAGLPLVREFQPPNFVPIPDAKPKEPVALCRKIHKKEGSRIDAAVGE